MTKEIKGKVKEEKEELRFEIYVSRKKWMKILSRDFCQVYV